jgi:hypothetical protein
MYTYNTLPTWSSLHGCTLGEILPLCIFQHFKKPHFAPTRAKFSHLLMFMISI